MDLSKIDLKKFLLATVIVSAGIYLVSQSSAQAGWLLAFTILIGVAFANENFGTELKSILNG